MSTRSTIKIEGIESVKVYKHFDGYPESTLPWLEHFNREFYKKRGDDPEYKFAQLLRSSARDADTFNLDPSDSTGWGVVPYQADYGAEFEYTLKGDGTVEVENV